MRTNKYKGLHRHYLLRKSELNRQKVKDYLEYFGWWEPGVNPVVDDERYKWIARLDRYCLILEMRRDGKSFKEIGELIWPHRWN
jgi:hypothetical protein